MWTKQHTPEQPISQINKNRKKNLETNDNGNTTHHSLLKDIPHPTKKKHTNGQQVHEKVLNITNHQENANHNHYEISPHTFLNGYHQKAKGGTDEDEEKGTLAYCCWECKLVQPLWKSIWRFLKKLKNTTTIWSSNHTSGYISKENENRFSEISALLCLLRH